MRTIIFLITITAMLCVRTTMVVAQGGQGMLIEYEKKMREIGDNMNSHSTGWGNNGNNSWNYTPSAPKPVFLDDMGVPHYSPKAAAKANAKYEKERKFKEGHQDLLKNVTKLRSTPSNTLEYNRIYQPTTSVEYVKIGQTAANKLEYKKLRDIGKEEDRGFVKQSRPYIPQNRSSYDIMKEMAAASGINLSNYFSEAEWNRNPAEMTTEELFMSAHKTMQLMDAIYGSDPLYNSVKEFQAEFKTELVDAGINIMENDLSIGVGMASSIYGTPITGAFASGFVKFGAAALKDLNHDKPIDWRNAIVSGVGGTVGNAVGEFENLGLKLGAKTITAITTEYFRNKNTTVKDAAYKGASTAITNIGTEYIGSVTGEVKIKGGKPVVVVIKPVVNVFGGKVMDNALENKEQENSKK